jgi:hypothetical protein
MRSCDFIDEDYAVLFGVLQGFRVPGPYRSDSALLFSQYLRASLTGLIFFLFCGIYRGDVPMASAHSFVPKSRLLVLG